jgi:hypothetical protein
MDAQYLRKNFPQIKVNESSTIMLRGVGNNQTHGWMNAEVHFVNDKKEYTSITGVFHVVTSLATKIIVGNDVLAEEGAVIDLKAGTCTFKSSKGSIPITSLKPKVDMSVPPSARLQAVYNIKPGYQARVPVALTALPSTELYFLEPVAVNEDIQVSRSIGNSKGIQHYAHVMNVGKNIVKLPSNIVLARVAPVQDTRTQSTQSNVVEQESEDNLEAFEEALQVLWDQLTYNSRSRFSSNTCCIYIANRLSTVVRRR